MCPAWYYLTGMMALAGAQPLLQNSKHVKKLLAKALFDRNVEKVVCFIRIRKSARDEILTIFCLKTIGFFRVSC